MTSLTPQAFAEKWAGVALQNAHERLDRAVFAAYGWPEDVSDEEILKNLLALNLERSGATPD